jgi:hypothetical protein
MFKPTSAETAMTTPKHPAYIVAVDSFEGDVSAILVQDESGAPLPAVYCIARRDERTGVLQFVDYGYRSIEEARAAWPDAE